MPNSGSLCHPHGLEEAPVAHRPDPGQLQRIWLIFDPALDYDSIEVYEQTHHAPGDYYVYHGEQVDLAHISDEEVEGLCSEYQSALEGLHQFNDETYRHHYSNLRAEYVHFVEEAHQSHPNCNCQTVERW